MKPLTLTGSHVMLEALSHEHHDGLVAAVSDGEIYKLWFTPVPSPEEMMAEIERRMALQIDGSMIPFAIRRTDTGKLCGMTTFVNIDKKDRSREIGYTWYAASAQRTSINTECKLLMLTHAFEAEDCRYVCFQTHGANKRSQAAILRLGAVPDALLHQERTLKDAGFQDRHIYSIQASAWPEVKNRLVKRLERGLGNKD